MKRWSKPQESVEKSKKIDLIIKYKSYSKFYADFNGSVVSSNFIYSHLI